MSGTAFAIPASQIVSVTPSVLSAGGNALDLVGVFLTQNARVPVGQVLNFPTLLGVQNYFGLSSQEASLATTYFLGFDNSNAKPGQINFAFFNFNAVGGWLRGGALSGMTLTQLQAIAPGAMVVSIDGTPVNSTTINLSTATSFSDAAERISVALGTIGPAGAAFSGTIATNTLTVSGLTGSIAVGQEVHGIGVTAGTLITAQTSSTVFTVNNAQTLGPIAMTSNTPACTYDSVAKAFQLNSGTTGVNSAVGYPTGAIATALNLTLVRGAIVSTGALAASPATFMSSITAITQDWATFTTMFDPDFASPGTNTNKQAFAAWVNGTVDRYCYVCWDTDVTPTLSTAAVNSLGFLLDQSDSNGTAVVWAPDATQGPIKAAFIMGSIASIDFTEHNGRATLAFRGQSGLAPDVIDGGIASNLEANNYNYYGIWGTANDKFNFLYPGSVSGPFEWLDSYIDQIWLNAQFQLALMVLLVNVKSLPYNQEGYNLIKAACQDVINQGLDFGAFRFGVTLSQAQIAEVNSSAGLRIDDVLQRQGWYLQVRDALPQVRAARQSPPCTFWYMDGGSIQRIHLASIEIQ